MITPAAQPVVEFENVTFRYEADTESSPVVDDVTFTVDKQDFLGLIGPNGGGKSTLLKLMLGLLVPQEGTVRVMGRQPYQVRRKIGYVPQYSRVDATVPATVLDVVLMGRLCHSSWGAWFGTSHKKAAQDALEQTNTLELADRPIGTLSGGQRQRVLIARALASDAQLLLLDEPTAGVDAHIEQGLTDLLHELNEQLPIVMVSHDISFVCAHLNRVACMNRKLSCHAAAEITDDVIAEMYEGQMRLVHHEDDCPLHDPGCEHDCHPDGEPVKHEHGTHHHASTPAPGSSHAHSHSHRHDPPKGQGG